MIIVLARSVTQLRYFFATVTVLQQQLGYICKLSLVCPRVADPHHCNADPDKFFHFNVDPDPTFHIKADPDPAPHQSDANL